ncbi:MAG: hypothetical protein K2Y32_08585 [Candidatus Obscuribacterales bacterium]|nr:hypothetical protein [Candidatus Obscuribacterales bacterium]
MTILLERSLLKRLEDLRLRRLLVVLDRDGTLVPICANSEDACFSPSMRRLLSDLAGLPGVQLCILSARSTVSLSSDDLAASIALAGNSGLEIRFPKRVSLFSTALMYLPLIARCRDEIEKSLSLASKPQFDEVQLDDHIFTLCLHFHRASDAVRRSVQTLVSELEKIYPALSFKRLDTSYEIEPGIGWSKYWGLWHIAARLDALSESAGWSAAHALEQIESYRCTDASVYLEILEQLSENYPLVEAAKAAAPSASLPNESQQALAAFPILSDAVDLMYIGDSANDEPAFRFVNKYGGLSIKVDNDLDEKFYKHSAASSCSDASFRIAGIACVEKLLRFLLASRLQSLK